MASKPLKMKTVAYYQVEYDDLDALLKEVFGFDEYWSAIESFGWSNDSDYTAEANIAEHDAWDWAAAEIQAFRDGTSEYHNLGRVLSYLAKEGHIPEGEYLITVCW